MSGKLPDFTQSPISPDCADDLLLRLYQAQEGLYSRGGWACRAGCHVCCTDKVLLTSLEARLLAKALNGPGGQKTLRMPAPPGKKKPQAAPTFNQSAKCCLEGREPPADPRPDSPAGPCPLLDKGLCSAYECRPMACRVMVSTQTCQPGGRAMCDEYLVTLGSALFQIAEHLSAGMWFGPLAGVMAQNSGQQAPGLSQCLPLPGLPAPARHTKRLQQDLAALFSRNVRGRPFGWWMDEISRRLAYGAPRPPSGGPRPDPAAKP